MAKQYTRAQWARRQASLPPEDRIPYDQSPEMPTMDPYVSPENVPTGSEEEVAAALAAAAEAEKISKDISAVGAKAYVEQNAPASMTTEEKNAILPKGQKITGQPIIGSTTTTTNPSFTASDGTKFYDEKSYREYQDYLDGKREKRQSAFDTLYEQFSRYGLGSLVEPLKNLISDPSVSPSEFTLRLRDTDAYKKRFAANAQRIAKGLSALSEGDYLGLEDQYQNIMRNYGLPASYYEKGDLGVQKNFENLIANDVSNVELEDRIQTAYNRVINAAPEVTSALKSFYPGITNGDILAYTLDPKNALNEIKRKVTAAEIGGAATQFGLNATAAGSEALAGYGINQAQARQGYQTIADILPRGSQLASIYKQEPYTQTTAESEVFGTPGAADARKRRERLAQLEQASFGGSAGTSNAIGRDRAGAF